MRESPDVSTDPFSDILKLANAEIVSSGGFTAGGTWAIRFSRMDKVRFGALVRGTGWMRIEDEAAIRIGAGDICLLSPQTAVTFSSGPDTPPIDAASVFGPGKPRVPALGKGNQNYHIGGYVRMDPVNGKMLGEVLPRLIHIRGGSDHATTLQALLDQLVRERAAELPGTSLVSTQLAQLIFVLILRAYLETSPAMTAGWLRALSDKALSPAIRLMHSEPSRSWRLEELAKATGMSRTVFIERFKAAAGVAPLTYLTNWRMRLAERMLRETDTPVFRLAHSLGYSSESAFSNAFKRVTGTAPRQYRANLGAAQLANSTP